MKRINEFKMIRYGMIVPLWESHKEIYFKGKIKKGASHYVCICDCGNIFTRKKSYIQKQRSVSCGCYRTKVTASLNKKHGMSGTKIYNAWLTMRNRCQNKTCKDFKFYGARGITFDNEWNKFENFYRDVGDPPSSKHSLDRIDNNKGYSSDNCKWSTAKEQSNNRRLRSHYKGIPIIRDSDDNRGY